MFDSDAFDTDAFSSDAFDFGAIGGSWSPVCDLLLWLDDED